LKEQIIDSDLENDYTPTKGKTTVAPAVLLTIAHITALQVPGVFRMSNITSGVNRLFQRDCGEGVRLDIHDDIVYANLYVILEEGANIRDVSRQVQNGVARAISETIGMQVGRVNIHIEDIHYSQETDPDRPQEN